MSHWLCDWTLNRADELITFKNLRHEKQNKPSVQTTTALNQWQLDTVLFLNVNINTEKNINSQRVLVL